MASGDTKTEALLNVLGNGGDASQYKGCCNTKSQSYILDAIDRIQNVEDEVEELKNNPDVVDIVDTYADLQAYDTQHLTENDIIRVLQDETHSGNSTYYRFTKNPDTWTFIGEISGGGGGEVVKSLSKVDYDFPTENPVGIALWQLDEGIYKLSEDGTNIIYNAANPIVFKITRNAGESFLVLKKANGATYMYDEVDDFQRPRLVWSAKNGTTGGTIATIKDSEVTTSLTETITGLTVLDGTVGKTLNDRIGDLSTLTTTAKTSAVAAINEIAQAAGGGVITLTSSDFDYPVADPQGIALWNLDTGIYTVGGSTSLKFYYNRIQSTNAGSGASFLVLHHGTKASVYWYDQTLDTPSYMNAQETYVAGSWSDLLQKKSIVNNLTTTNDSLVLSANQGYVLKGLIDALDARVSALEGN